MKRQDDHGGRQRFRCTKCGLVMEGRENSRGEILPYDRAAWDGSPERPAVCLPCSQGVKLR